MPRLPRFIPKSGALVEVTCRVIGARALLLPSPHPRRFNEVIVGVMGRALEVSPLDLCGCVWTANHFHLLVSVHEQQQLSRFMQHLNTNISKEIGGRLRKWHGPFWARRYDGIVVSDEPEAQWKRLKYLLSHGVKEGLVESPLDWPGVHSARALVHSEPHEGFWWNRSREWAALERGQDVGSHDFATRYLVRLAQLPAFRDLPPEEYRDKVAELIGEIEAEGGEKRSGNPVAGVEQILAQNPYEPPTKWTKRSPRPQFHVASKEARDALRAELSEYLAQFYVASEALLGGHVEAADWFPEGCFPPALPFVGGPLPPRAPSPPTRRLELLESGKVKRGEIPIVVPTGNWPRWPSDQTRRSGISRSTALRASDSTAARRVEAAFEVRRLVLVARHRRSVPGNWLRHQQPVNFAFDRP